MGASFEHQVYRGPATADQAYQELVSEALREYGHDAYNGTISTSNGFTRFHGEPMSVAAAVEVANGRVDTMKKWGAWLALPLAGVSATEEKVLSVTLRGAAARGSDSEVGKALADKAEQRAARKGWEVSVVGVRSWKREMLRPKVTRAAAPAKAVWSVLLRREDPRDFERKSDAVEFARRVAEETARTAGGVPWGFGDEVVQVRRRYVTDEGAAPVLEVSAQTSVLSAEVEVALTRVDPSKRDGWLFAGWAAS